MIYCLVYELLVEVSMLVLLIVLVGVYFVMVGFGFVMFGVEGLCMDLFFDVCFDLGVFIVLG